MLEIFYVGADKITLKGAIPEVDARYDGKDPLDRMCWQIKDKLLSEHNVCMYYQIDRMINIDGTRTIDITFMLSYTGKYEGCRRVVKDELFWTNMFSMELASLLDEFILDFNRGCKCERVKDPVRSLRIDPHDYQKEQSKSRKKKKKKKKNLPGSEKPNSDLPDNTQEISHVGFRKATDDDLSPSEADNLKNLPDEFFIDEEE